MKNYLVILSASLVLLAVVSAVDPNDFNSYEKDALNYVESEFGLVATLLGMDKRRSKASHYDEFVFGFADSAFKIQPRLATTCVTDGAQYWKGTKETVMNLINAMDINGQDEFNLEDVSYTFLRKCNYADTVQQTILSNLFINFFYELSDTNPMKLLLRPAFVLAWITDWYSMATAVMEWSWSLSRLMDRLDYYNIGKMTGKVFKVWVQLHAKQIL